jgi:hypothetical protein
MRQIALIAQHRIAVRWTAQVVAALACLAGIARPLTAQTDYYNTDAGRPITIEDAYAIERRAVEIQIAPFRLERSRGGAYAWGIEPEIAIGFLPRTQFEVGLPFTYVDAAGARTSGLAGIDLALLHNLNVETSIPALAIAADLLIPAGAMAPDKAYASVKGIATRTLPWARFHLNAQYTFADRVPTATGHGEVSQWMAGLAVDRTFPLRSYLVTAELVARQPIVEDEDVRWDTGLGMRYQVSPRIAADAGAGYRLTGDDQGWYLTFGAAVSLGLPWRAR